MKAVQPAAKWVEKGVSDKIKILRSGEKERVLTQSLEDPSWLLEFDVEVPASAEGTHGRFLPMTFAADHADFGTIRTLGERAGYAREIDVNGHPRKRSLSHHLLFGFKLLVRWFYHLVLLRQVDPKLEPTGLGLSGLVDRHFGVDDWK